MGASVSSLNEYFSKGLSGFFSYSREDDEDFNEVLSKFRTAIQSELAAQLGRKRDNFSLWQDKFAIPHGALWQKTIAQAINQSAFFIPIITPRVVASPHCAFEFELFLAREQELGRDDLVFPILYIRVRELDDGTWQQNPVLKIVKDRQYLDWRDYRTRKPSDQDVQDKIIEFCGNIANALLKPWESMEEQRQRQEEAERIAEQQQHRKTAEIAAARLAEEERQRREAEAEAVRRAEAERQRAAEAEAVRLAEAERQKAARRRPSGLRKRSAKRLRRRKRPGLPRWNVKGPSRPKRPGSPRRTVKELPRQRQKTAKPPQPLRQPRLRRGRASRRFHCSRRPP